MIPFSVAGIQMHISAVHENVTTMEQRLNLLMIKLPWVQMVVFSELAAYGPLTSNAVDLDNSDVLKRFQAMAVKHGVWLIPGSLFTLRKDKIYNTAVAINPQGQVVGKYDKMFPFYPYEKGVEPGSHFLIFDVPEVGRFGVSICYDIWFPETTRTLTSMGVEVLLHPVLTGTVDRDVELNIARSTAAMFQCYVVDVNGLGSGGNGRSSIVDASGTVLYTSANQEDQFALEIDLSQVRRQRETGVRNLGQTLKSFRDRKCEFPIYGSNSGITGYLNSLGVLEIPVRHSNAGIGKLAPQYEMPLNTTEIPAKTMDEAKSSIDLNYPNIPLPE
ncbi:MAG: carbon-nitrogen hydrolase family protein [Ostreibacterium sp.]